MSAVLDQLVSLLSLERIEENLFRGQSQDLGWGQVFGGQVLGQALGAAAQTVPSDRPVHSLQAYFVRHVREPHAIPRRLRADQPPARQGGPPATVDD